MNKKVLVITSISIILLTGCADTEIISQCLVDNPSGFWYGLWHGMISPISFVISLFNDSVSIYDVNNTGGWYDFGFLLGIGGVGFGSSKSTK